MKYRMKLSKLVYALTGIVIAVTFASIILNILILCGAGKLVQGNIPVTSTSLVCSIILFTICILILTNTKYALKENNLTVYFGIWTIKFPYEKILGVAKETILDRLFIQYSAPEKNGGFGVFAINISKSCFDNFIDELLRHNKDIHILNTEDTNNKQ